ncbi:MAG: acyl-[ACP]--phospholipid O-acyltransferase [Gammaproteobacteria bacterium]|nr:acyl-[ACP]--phospholipid O-acyltransferase [Gammaproteobacteria bacterium]
MIRQFGLLKERRFLPLFLTQFFGALNDNFLRGVLATLVIYAGTTLQHYSSVLSLAVAGVFMLPFFLFSALSGQIADKFEMSRLIRLSKIAELFIMSAAAYGVYHHQIFFLLFMMFCKGLQATFFGPLKYAILPSNLAENELIAGNGLIDGSTFLAILLGTILGTTLIFVPYGYTIVSVLLVLIAVTGLIASFYIPKVKISDPKLKVNPNIFQEMFKLMRYTARHTRIFLSVLAISWFWFFGITFTSGFPAYTRTIIHGRPDIMTFFLTVFSVGIAVGSLLCNKILRGRINTTFVPISALMMSLFTIDLYHASQYFLIAPPEHLMTLSEFLVKLAGWRIIFDLFMLSVMSGLFIVPLFALIQHEGEPSHLSRIIASNNLINSLFMVASVILAAGLLTLGLSISHVFYLVGLMNIVVAIYICRLLPDALPRSIVQAITKLLYRVEVHGMENYYAAGKRVVIVANHTSYLDAALFAAFFPDKLTFAINTMVSNVWWVKAFTWLTENFPIDPTKPMGIKSLIEYVRKNKRVIIFPEGRVTVTGALMKIYEGPGMIADKSRAKLLPIRIDGAEYTFFSRLSGKEVPTKWFPKITITIMPPQSFDVDDGLVGRKRRQAISAKLYDLMKEMMLVSSSYQKPLFYSLIESAEIHGHWHTIAEDIRREPIRYHKLLLGAFVLGRTVADVSTLGENIGMLLPNTIAAAVLFFGLQAFGRVPAMLNFSSGAKNILAACRVAKISRVYTSRQFIEKAKLEPVIAQLEQYNITVVYLEALRDKISILRKLWGMIISYFPKTYYKHYFKIKTDQDLMLQSHNPAVVLFTSGSEGTPKGVVLSHANIQANRFQISASIDFGRHDILFNALPIFHSFGLTGGMILPFLLGTRVFFYPSPLHFRIIPELVYDTSSTILFGTDTFLAKYAQFAHPYDFYSVRYVFAGAEKLRDETRQIWSEKFGVRILEGYGTTEAAPILSLNTPMLYKKGTVGKLLPGIHYRLEPVEGIAEGGRLWVSGPNIMLGYLLDKHPGELVMPPDGWYDTGDVVSVDDDGFITIRGRAKRFAKIGGEMISLTAVEEAVSHLWPGFVHAVLNLPDERKGEQLLLITTYPEADRRHIVEFFKKEGMSELSLPKRVKVIKSMPLLGSGKVDYVTLKETVGL